MDITPLPVVVVDTGLWVVRERRQEEEGGERERGEKGGGSSAVNKLSGSFLQ